MVENIFLVSSQVFSVFVSVALLIQGERVHEGVCVCVCVCVCVQRIHKLSASVLEEYCYLESS